jgi:hypothetical protein
MWEIATPAPGRLAMTVFSLRHWEATGFFQHPHGLKKNPNCILN